MAAFAIIDICQAFDVVSGGAKDLLNRMLIREPMKRISSVEALDHRFVAQTARMRGERRGEDSTSVEKGAVLQRESSFQRLVDFNAAQRRWGKVRAAYFVLFKDGSLRKQIEEERARSQAAQDCVLQESKEQARLTTEMDAVQRQKNELSVPGLNRWRGRATGEVSPNQRAQAWLQAGADRKRQAAAKRAGLI